MWSSLPSRHIAARCRHLASLRAAISLSSCPCVHPTVLHVHRGGLSNFNRTFLSAVSATGFNDYELERRRFRWDVPEFYNFADVMDSWAKKEQNGQRPGSHPALWWVHEDGREKKYTFKDVQNYSKKIANILTRECHLQKGDIVMVILPRVPEWWFINIASVRAGLVLIPGTSLLKSGDIKDRLLRSKAKCIVADDHIAQEVDMIANDCPDLKTKLLVSSDSGSRAGWLDYRELFEKASPLHENVKTSSDETFLAFFTSGTTGKPKLIEHSHASGSLGHLVTGRYWYDLVSTDIIQCLSDTGWAKAAYGNLYGPWIQGACVFIHQSASFNPEEALNILDRYPISVFCAPPTAYRMMIQQHMDRFDLRSVRHWVGAGEPVNPEVIDVWKKVTDLQLYEGYGQSETTLLIGMFKCLEYRPTSMGKPPPGVEVAIVADDMSTELPPGEEGNIAVPLRPRGTVGLFKGYMTEADRTSEVFGRDYYLTGDRGYKDEDGYYYFVGRDDDIITSAGYRIGPFEVESALQEHPAVVESGAVAVRDEVRGEVVKAFIVLADRFKDRNPEELKKELQEHVKNVTAPYKYPRQIAFVDHLPKTVSGKIRRVELRDSW